MKNRWVFPKNIGLRAHRLGWGLICFKDTSLYRRAIQFKLVEIDELEIICVVKTYCGTFVVITLILFWDNFSVKFIFSLRLY